jgi:transcriptional regulator with PAS, ATPase and Fis domain
MGRERHVRKDLLGRMIGRDPKMQLVFELVRQVARIDVSVLITGETGTGKELVARSIHDMSRRRKRTFGAVNCAALPEALFESQVFGHARGAFTGAVRAHAGLVEECDGGTLFLDEIGELSVANQVKLLRVLQEGTYTRLGETHVRSSDFRLVCATNRDLVAMAHDGTFREDLYYRLNVFPIRLPSLRERPEDLPILIDGILESQMDRFPEQSSRAEIAVEALEQLRAYHWPGNVRELENVVTRSLIIAGGGDIAVEHLPSLDASTPVERPAVEAAATAVDQSLADVERDHIVRVLKHQQGNLTKAATVLGVSRTTLYKKLRDHDIGPRDGLPKR